MSHCIWVIIAIISFIVQFIMVARVYREWKDDCKTIGKEHLAVSLGARIAALFILFPVYWIGIAILLLHMTRQLI